MVLQKFTNSKKSRFPNWVLGVLIGAIVYYLILGVILIVVSANPITPGNFQAVCRGEESYSQYYQIFLRDALVSPGSWIIEKICDLALSGTTRENPLRHYPVYSAFRDYGPMVISGLVPASIGWMLSTRKWTWQMLGAVLGVVFMLYVIVAPFLSLFAICTTLDLSAAL